MASAFPVGEFVPKQISRQQGKAEEANVEEKFDVSKVLASLPRPTEIDASIAIGAEEFEKVSKCFNHLRRFL